MARPRKDDEEKRSDQLNIRLTGAERVRLEHKAAAIGVTLADYIRDRGLGYRLRHRAVAQQADALALTTLNRLGVNLNQVAHHLNAGWASTGTDAALQALLGEIQATMQGLMRGPQADGRRPEF